MRRDVLIYISGPITACERHSIEENVAEALYYYFQCLKRGWPAFCPHLSAAFPSVFSIDYEKWIAYDYVIIDRCTHLLMLPRWRDSRGAQRERDYAETHGKTIVEHLDDLHFELPPDPQPEDEATEHLK